MAQALSARGSAPAWAVDQFERAALGPDWFQFAEVGAPSGQGSVSITDGHNAQGDPGVDSLAGFSPFAPTPGSAYACIKDAGSIDGQEACVCLGVDAAAGDALCCCLKSEGPTKFEMFGWQNGSSINPVPPVNLAHSIGDFMAITRTSANTFRCLYAASATPTTWIDLTGDVAVNNIVNPGRGGVYFYSNGERAAQFEVGTAPRRPRRTCAAPWPHRRGARQRRHCRGARQQRRRRRARQRPRRRQRRRALPPRLRAAR